jgi:hypothetical protein
MALKLLIVTIVLLLSSAGHAAGVEGSGPVADPEIAERAAEAESEKTPAGPTLEELAEKLAALEEAQRKQTSRSDALSRLRISGYIQPQYVHDESSIDELSGTSTGNRDQFSVRRGRVKFTYQATPTSRFVLQPDVSSSGVSLKDGYLDLIEPWTSWKHTLTAGQFIWPFGFELQNSSSSREMPERARAIRTLFAGERDRGVMLSGASRGFRYQIAVVNGTATQSFDPNKRKDVVGRVGYTIPPLTIGASVYRGAELVATRDAPAGVEFARTRTGLDFEWRTPIEGLAVRGEYVTGRQAPAPGTTRSQTQDAGGWLLYLTHRAGKRHQFALRLDEFDPDTDLRGNAVRTLGGSYIFQWDPHSRVMFAYEQPKQQTSDPKDDVFTLRYQFSF